MTDNWEEEQERKAIADRDALLRELQLEDDFVGIMTTVPGRRFVWAMLDKFGIFAHNFDESHAAMSYHEGRRSVGLYLMDYIQKTCPHLYHTMAQENAIKTEV